MITSSYTTLTGTVSEINAQITSTNAPMTIVKVKICDGEDVLRTIHVKAFGGRAVALATVKVGEHMEFVGRVKADGFVPEDEFEPIGITTLHPSGWRVVPAGCADGITTQLTGFVTKKTSAWINDTDAVMECDVKVTDDEGRIEFVTVKAYTNANGDEARNIKGALVSDAIYIEGEPQADAFINRDGKVVRKMTIKNPAPFKLNYRVPSNLF